MLIVKDSESSTINKYVKSN